jgi:predicted DNA binding protein
MQHARFRIRLPENTWIAGVSEEYPRSTFRLLSGLKTGAVAVELGEILTDHPVEIRQAIGGHDAIGEFVELAATDEKLLIKYESTDTGLYSFAEDLALPLQFPIVVRNGWYRFGLTGTRPEFERVRDRLEDADCRFELLSVVGEPRDSDLLTDRQREVLTAAVQRGYFSVPRNCTLSDLAVQFGADESTLSGVLRRGQERVLTAYLDA